MPPIRTVSCLNCVNIIRILLPLSLPIPGTLWKSSGTLTFLKWILSCRTAILLLALNQDSLLICSVPSLSLWKNGIRDCKCDRIYSQPDCDIGWDSHRNCYYFGYDLYTFTASDSENDLPVFPFLGPASRHDSILSCFFPKQKNR